MKRAVLVIVVCVAVWLAVGGVARASLPNVPKGLIRLGVVEAGQPVVVAGPNVFVLITTAPAFFTLMSISWTDSWGGSGIKRYFFDLEGTGGFVTPDVYFRCYSASCAVGEIAIYAPAGWVRGQ